MVDMILDALKLQPSESAGVAMIALLVLYTLDGVTSTDDVPGNTPREWILRIAGWRSRGFWRRDNRERARAAGEWGAAFAVAQLLPLTGAIVPFMAGVLLGHFFHPAGLVPPVESGLAWISGLALTIGVGTWWQARRQQRVGAEAGAALVLVGIICGMVLWPVGA